MPLVVVVLVAGPATSAPTWGGLEAVWMLRMAYAEESTQEMLQTRNLTLQKRPLLGVPGRKKFVSGGANKSDYLDLAAKFRM